MEKSNTDEILIEVEIEGTRPLLQNKPNLKSSSASKRKGMVYDDKEEAEKRLIKNVSGEICQPGIQIECCMVKSATDFKMSGRKTYKDAFKGGVIVSPDLIPHQIKDSILNS